MLLVLDWERTWCLNETIRSRIKKRNENLIELEEDFP